MDWNKVSGLAGVGSFVVGAAALAVMVWPQLPGKLPGQAAVAQLIGWGPVIVLAACLVLAGWLHLKAAQLSRSADRQLSPPPVQPAPSLATVAPVLVAFEEEPVFLDKSPIDLEKPFSGDNELTTYQAQLLVADYLDKWVRWNLRVINVSPSIIEGVTRVSAHVPKEEGSGVFVNMRFLFSERPKVIHLGKGAQIEVEGRVEEIFMATVNLIDCRLVSRRAQAETGSL